MANQETKQPTSPAILIVDDNPQNLQVLGKDRKSVVLGKSVFVGGRRMI